MGKASSAKKVAKVARSSAVSGPGGRGRFKLGFGALVAAVLISGLLLVGWARASRDVGPTGPDATEQWQIAYGVYVCDEFVADGVKVVSPIDDTTPTGRTTIASLVGSDDVVLTDGSVTLADGTEIATGEDCNGEPAVLSVTTWDAGSDADSAGLRRDGGFVDVALSGDGEQITIAVTPAGTDIPRPPVAPAGTGATNGTGDDTGDDPTPTTEP